MSVCRISRRYTRFRILFPVGAPLWRTAGVIRWSGERWFLNRIGEEHNIFTDNDDPIRYFYLGFRFRDACLTRTEYRSLKDFFDTAQPRMVTAGDGDTG